MDFKQCEARNRAVLLNAIEWANNRECNPLEQFDIVLLGEYLRIPIPVCFNNFVLSDNPDQAKICGAAKTIFKTLDKIKIAILDNQLNKFIV